MPAIDARPFITWILEEYEPSLRVPGGPGHYGRVPGRERVHLYGTSDMACVLHTIGHLQPDEEERRSWARAFASFQDPETGWLREYRPTHDELHNTAFALAAMELLSLRSEVPLRFMEQYRSPDAVTSLLNDLDWQENAYGASHLGAGIGAIAALYPETVDTGWFDAWFAAVERHVDPRHGLVGDDKPEAGDVDQIGATFHYHFLYEYLHRRLPEPEGRIQTVIGLRADGGYWRPDNMHYLTLDALYLCTRTVRHHGIGRSEVEGLTRSILDNLQRDVLTEAGRHEHFTEWYLGAHSLTAVVSILAEAQAFLGAEEVVSDRPLQLVLDRRPFI